MKEIVLEQNDVKCDNCGAALDLGKSTKCAYCGSQKDVKQDVKSEFSIYTYSCSSCKRHLILDYGVAPDQCFFCNSAIDETPIKIHSIIDIFSLEVSKDDMIKNLNIWANKGLGTSALWRYKLLNDDSSKFISTYLPVNIEYNPGLTLNIYEFVPIDSKVASFLTGNKKTVGREASKAKGGKGTKFVPAYLGAVNYGSKRYYYIVNGVTGEVQGERKINVIQEFIMKLLIGILLILAFFFVLGIYFTIFGSKK